MSVQQGRPRGRRNRKMVVLAIGGVGLAVALTLAAFAAPDRAANAARTYTPTDPKQVIVKVPTRDPGEVAARRQLSTSPELVDVAVQLARVDIERYRTLADPRYLGRAQATLARWWKVADAAPDVLLLRATINHALRDLPAARADLDKLVSTRPTDDAHALRAAVAIGTADYAAARHSCAAITDSLAAATCEAPLGGVTGTGDVAYAKLVDALPRSTGLPGVRKRAMTALAELALQRGDSELAIRHLKDALGIDDDDIYARDLWFDILLAGGRAAEAQKLLAGRESVDSHLVRLAVAEHALRSTDRGRLAGLMRERIEAATLRGDRIHPRDEARFALVIEASPQRALELARENWNIEKELADARLLAEAAAAAGDRAAATPVIDWATTNNVRDAWLATSLAKLR